ncbi:hypothetical protein K438DRAFT_1959128 [Mycena galopus ATCC 62051]|nr:hypothetical protein K438DRAFT_1959128 [Mycena galopus ATCC 62051]
MAETQLARTQSLNVHLLECQTANPAPQVEIFQLLARDASRWEELSLQPSSAPLLLLVDVDLRGGIRLLRKVFTQWNDPLSHLKFVRVRRVVVVVGDDDSEFDDSADLAAVLELFTNVRGVQSIIALTVDLEDLNKEPFTPKSTQTYWRMSTNFEHSRLRDGRLCASLDDN